MRLIDAHSLMADIPTIKDEYKYVRRIIRKQPTVDAVPVIRCKDCKHWTVTCDDDYQSCECDALIRHKDFYCARAERKEE